MPTNTFQDILDALEGENVSPEFRQLLAKKADAMFQAEKSQKEWESLTRLSGVIISEWELKEILAKVPEGKSVVISNGEIYIGRISPERLEKMTKIRKRVPGKKFLNVDDAENTYREIVSKSFAEPAIVKGFKNAWVAVVKKGKETSAHPLLVSFLNYVENHPEKKLSHKIEQIGRQDFRVTLSVEGIKTRIVTNTFGRMVGYYLPSGKFVDTDGKNF